MVNPFRFLFSSGPVASSVTTRHPDWLDAQAQWKRISHVLAGTDDVRRNAHDYIPMTEGNKQSPGRFEAMVARTAFTNFTARAVDGLEGLIFRKDPTVTVPARYKLRLENINNAGDSINTFSKKAAREVLTYGRVGILVDQVAEEDQRFQSPTSSMPYLTIYGAQAITNWRPRTVAGQVVADQVVLEETYEDPQEFGGIIRSRYRVLELDEESRYRVRLYEQGHGGGEYSLVSEVYPKTGKSGNERYFNRIPFIFVNPIDLGMQVRRSPILDLVDANLAHFLLESEYATALFYSSQPTPVITGWPEGLPADFLYGGDSLWVLPEKATASILEFRGHGLQPIEHALAAKERQIAELGARLVENASAGPETAEAARIRQHSQTSVVSSIAMTVSDGLRAALEIAAQWSMADGKVSFELNQDYLDAQMAPQMLAQIVRATQAGLMTRRDAVYNMQKGELLQPGRTIDQILGELETQDPGLTGVPDMLQISSRGQDRGGQPAFEDEAA